MGTKGIEEALADETDKLVYQIIELAPCGVIAGFPCQDISLANTNGAALSGARSGLFWELIKTIRLVAFRFVLLENVAALFTKRGQIALGTIFSELASIGYDIEWDCVSSEAVGAPHFRARAFILAHVGSTRGERLFPKEIQGQPEFSWCKDVRRLEDLPNRPDLYPSKLCRSGVRVTKRLHGIGNGNPPCIIRELTRGLK